MSAPVTDRLSSADQDHIDWTRQLPQLDEKPSTPAESGLERAGRIITNEFLASIPKERLHDVAVGMIEELERALRAVTDEQREVKTADSTRKSEEHETLDEKDVDRTISRAERDERRDFRTRTRIRILSLFTGNGIATVEKRRIKREERSQAKLSKLAIEAAALTEQSKDNLHDGKLGRRAEAARAEHKREEARQNLYNQTRAETAEEIRQEAYYKIYADYFEALGQANVATSNQERAESWRIANQAQERADRRWARWQSARAREERRKLEYVEKTAVQAERAHARATTTKKERPLRTYDPRFPAMY